MDRDISSQLPKIAIISPSSGGIPVAFGVRDALSAEQIYWAEQENGKRMFRQYINKGEVNPCIIVDDIIRSGQAIEETVGLVEYWVRKLLVAEQSFALAQRRKPSREWRSNPWSTFDAHMYDSGDGCS